MLAARNTTISRRTTVRCEAAAWTKVSSTSALQSAGGKTVVEVGGQKILLAAVSGLGYTALANRLACMG